MKKQKEFIYPLNQAIKKTLTIALLLLCSVAIFSSCKNEPEITSDIISEASLDSEIPHSEEEQYDLFKRHGLFGIIPEKYIKCSLVAETSETSDILLTEYEFTVLTELDDELERQGYYNQIINAVKKASFDENVYKNSENGLIKLSVYEDRVSSSETLVCYFKMKTGEETKLYKLTASDLASEGIHLYSLSLTYSDIDF